MTTTHHYHAHRPSPLEIRQLAEFDAALGDLSEDEKRRRRIAYLKDAARQLQLGASIMKRMGCLFIPFAIIPVFWPMFILLYFIRKKSMRLMADQFNGALDYWGIRREEIMDVPAQPPSLRRGVEEARRGDS